MHPLLPDQSMSRFLPASLRLFLLVLASSASVAAAGSEWKVESSHSRGLVLLWENASRDPDGRTAVRTASIALPAGSRPIGTMEVIDEQGMDAGQKGSEAFTFLVSAPARFRDLELAALTLEPARA